MIRKGSRLDLVGMTLRVVAVFVVTAALASAQSPRMMPVPGDETDLREQPKRLSDYDIPGLDQVVNLQSLDPMDAVEVIEFLAFRGGLKNVVIGPGVAGRTTKLRFEGVTVGDALEVVLSVSGLAYEVKGGIISIMSDEEYLVANGNSFYDNKQVRVVDLTYADPVHLSSMLEPVKSDQGTVVADPITGTLILIDTPGKIREMRAIIDKADMNTVSRIIPTETRTYALQYAEVPDIASQVPELLTKDIGSVLTDQRTKTLIVTDLPHALAKVEHLIAVFDQRPKEVFIEAKIVQVALDDEFELGVNWDHVLQGLNPRFSLGSVSSPGGVDRIGDLDTPTGTLTYKTIVGGGELTAVLEALKTVGETKILSNPHVAVLDGEEATIKVVTDEPYAEASLESGTTNVVGENIVFIEVGVTLSVTPRINDKGFISTSIKPEVSSKVGDYQAFRSVPIIQRANAETTVMVKDGQTIIIAGMIENATQSVESRVPFLGAIPLIGVLFRSVSDEIRNRELVVFLTPRIVTGETAFPMSRDLKKKRKPLRGLRGGAAEAAL